MTEEIEAHVLKKYEILQKLGKFPPHHEPKLSRPKNYRITDPTCKF